LFAADSAARMKIVEKVETLTDIGFGENIAELFGDFDGAFNKELSRTVWSILFLAIPAAMRHHDRMDSRLMDQPCLIIELLKIHVLVFYNLFKGFTKKIVHLVKANSTLWAETAIMITFDEGGGYWDSGYVQPLDFFGDGTRIPMIVVSPFSKGGHISHTYTDHVSTLKFIEANWGLSPITSRSRDNLPNPVTESNPYVPVNSPAIGDLMDLFNFDN
jgi:Phosphoesterase family